MALMIDLLRRYDRKSWGRCYFCFLATRHAVNWGEQSERVKMSLKNYKRVKKEHNKSHAKTSTPTGTQARTQHALLLPLGGRENCKIHKGEQQSPGKNTHSKIQSNAHSKIHTPSKHEYVQLL